MHRAGLFWRGLVAEAREAIALPEARSGVEVRVLPRPGVDWRRAVTLAALLAGVAVLAYHPHWNPLLGRDTSYPIHMDEYVHWGYAGALLRDGTVAFRDPFTGAESAGFSPTHDLHEVGFQAYLAAFQATTGIPWISIFEFGPAALSALLALAAYAVCERWRAGLWAVAFVACIPSTLRFLGPNFLVPIAFSLPLLAIGIFALAHARGAGATAIVLLVSAGLWTIHAKAAAFFVVVAALHSIALLPTDPRRSAPLLLALALSSLAAWGIFASHLKGRIVEPHLIPSGEAVLLVFGFVPFLAGAFGSASLLSTRRPDDFAIGLALSVACVILEGVLLWRLWTGNDVLNLYDRGFMLLFFSTTLLAAAGMGRLAALARRIAARAGPVVSRRRRVGGLPAGLAATFVLLAALTVFASARVQMAEPYYVIATEEQHAAYARIGKSLDAVYAKAVVEGLSTMPFSIHTGIPTVYVHLPTEPGADPPHIRDFFDAAASDTYFLVVNGASVVVTDREVRNPDLAPAGVPGVYLLREDYARRIAAGLSR